MELRKMLQEGGEAAKIETMTTLIKIVTNACGDGTLLTMFRARAATE
jgi:hypothetical protein